jgi:hypothetical protein
MSEMALISWQAQAVSGSPCRQTRVTSTISLFDAQSHESTENAGMVTFCENPEYAYTPLRFQHDTIPEKTSGP